MSQGKIKNADLASGAAIDRAKIATGTANGVVVNDSGGALSSVAPGANGFVLTLVGGAPAWSAPAGGLTNFTDAANSSAPNATVPVVSLTATNAATNVDAAFVAKGTGASLAQMPDNTATGGNKRGNYATDWQKSRASSDQVASGNQSFIGGGLQNTASGTNSVVCGGSGNIASNSTTTVAGGGGNTASGSSAAVGGGESNTASAQRAVIAGGWLNRADGQHSWVPGGVQATTRSIYGKGAFASGAFSSQGDAQSSVHVTKLATTDATTSSLTATGAAPSATGVNVLPNSATYLVEAHIVARDTSTGDSATWVLRTCAKRGASAAATTVSTVQTTFSYADAGAASWTATLAANTTLGAVVVQVTGAAATTIHWVATMHTTEVQ